MCWLCRIEDTGHGIVEHGVVLVGLALEQSGETRCPWAIEKLHIQLALSLQKAHGGIFLSLT